MEVDDQIRLRKEAAMLDLEANIEYCKELLIKLNIPVPFDKIDCIKVKRGLRMGKGRRILGRCDRFLDPETGQLLDDEHQHFQIYIDKDVMDTGSEKALRETIVHEMLHTMPKCFDHGYLWDRYYGKVMMNTDLFCPDFL